MFLELFAGLSNFPAPTAASNGAAASGRAQDVKKTTEERERIEVLSRFNHFRRQVETPSGFQAG